jgi:hypothetical protein
MIFVVGGTNYSEIQMMKEISNQRPDLQIFFGSTSIVTPTKCSDNLFKQVS